MLPFLSLLSWTRKFCCCPSMPCMKLTESFMTTRYLSCPVCIFQCQRVQDVYVNVYTLRTWLFIGLICTHCTTGFSTVVVPSVTCCKHPCVSILRASAILSISLVWLSGVSVAVEVEDWELSSFGGGVCKADASRELKLKLNRVAGS